MWRDAGWGEVEHLASTARTPVVDRVVLVIHDRQIVGLTLQILIATDLAARGIDVKELAFVVHYQLPEKSEYYTHRSGRTGRAGNKGFSLSMITPRELEGLKSIEKELGIKVKEILR